MNIRTPSGWLLLTSLLCVGASAQGRSRVQQDPGGDLPKYSATAPLNVPVPGSTAAPVRVYSHPDGVAAVSFSPDGKVLAAGDESGSVWLWPVDSNELLGSLQAHKKGVRALSWSPDGTLLATGGGEGWVHVWDTRTRKLQSWLDFKHRDIVTGLTFTRTGELLISGSEDDSIWVRDVVTGKKVTSYFGHSADVKGLAVSPDGQCVVSGAEDRSLQSWSIASGEQIDFAVQNAKLTTLALSGDGKLLASATSDGSISLRRTNGCSINTVALRLAWHTAPVRALVFSRDGKWLYSAGDDRVIVRWDLEHGTPIELFQGHEDSISSLALSPRGELLASGGLDHTVRLWKLDTVAPLVRVTPAGSTVVPTSRATSQSSVQPFTPDPAASPTPPPSMATIRTGPATVAGP